VVKFLNGTTKIQCRFLTLTVKRRSRPHHIYFEATLKNSNPRENPPCANRNHKDSVFSFLFSEPDTLRELYSAIEGITLPLDMPIDVNTLSSVLFMKKINDISFLIDNRLVVLVEHQSGINENIPCGLPRGSLFYLRQCAPLNLFAFFTIIFPNRGIFYTLKTHR